MKKKVYISVINDLVTDQRVHRIAKTICDSGYSVTIIGRRLRNSKPCEFRSIRVKRFRLIFNKGFLFYASFNIRLFLFLFTRQGSRVYISNDLDTLPANFLASRFRPAKLVYDSHEYFTEVPELMGRKFVKNFWKGLERMLVPRVNAAYTVNDSLAKMYSAKYGIEFGVIRNVPDGHIDEEAFLIPDEYSKHDFIIYQGSVNKDRGLEEMLEIMVENNNYKLVIAGDGDVIDVLKRKAKNLGIENRVLFVGQLRPRNLRWLTKQAALGISLEKKTNLNYYYALPNKIFDYIYGGIPVLCSGFPEMRKIVQGYDVGTIVDPDSREEIQKSLEYMLGTTEAREKWKENTRVAARELNWKNEQNKLISIYKKVGIEIQL
ncbi:MAG: glycosyltransferase [Bacteroidota bacterium]